MFDQFYEKMQELQKQTLQQIQKIESKSNVSQRNHDQNQSKSPLSSFSRDLSPPQTIRQVGASNFGRDLASSLKAKVPSMKIPGLSTINKSVDESNESKSSSYERSKGEKTPPQKAVRSLFHVVDPTMLSENSSSEN